jgi:hypothetical protein
MAYEANDSQPAKKSPAAQHPNDAVVQERVQELTWSMLDEQLADDEFRLLDNLLLSDDKARRTYLGCVQLHTDLIHHFRQPAATGAAGISPLLISVNAEESAVGFEFPSVDDTKT